MTNNDRDIEEAKSESEPESRAFPATVATVLDPYTLVINRGIRQGVKDGQKFLIYGVTEEELTDPETGKKLGFLEIVRGTGKVIHVQENMSTVSSLRRYAPSRTIRRKKSSMWGFTEPEEIETIEPSSGELMPFTGAEVGDKARPV